MFKVESVKARGLETADLLASGNVVVDKAYSPVDDKFIFSVMSQEDTITLIKLMEEDDTEGEFAHFFENITVFVAKATDSFEVAREV